MEILNWSNVPVEHVSPLQTRKVIHTQEATVVRLVSRKGATVPLHHHMHVQLTMLESGRFSFGLEGETVTLQPGDFLRIPSDVPHQGVALEDSVTIEMFIPAREDWIGVKNSAGLK